MLELCGILGMWKMGGMLGIWRIWLVELTVDKVKGIIMYYDYMLWFVSV